MRLSRIALMAGIGGLAFVAAAQGQTVTNGGFEDNANAFVHWPGYVGGNPGGAGTPSGANPPIAGWAGIGGHGINRVEAGAMDAPFAPSGYNFGDNGHFAFLQGAGTTLTQEITGLTPGGLYVLTYEDATRSGNTGGLTASIAGASLVTAPSNAAFTDRSLDFSPAGSTATLTFTNTSPAGDNTVDIDNVAITVVPEPAALGLLALGGLGLLSRRRRA